MLPGDIWRACRARSAPEVWGRGIVVDSNKRANTRFAPTKDYWFVLAGFTAHGGPQGIPKLARSRTELPVAHATRSATRRMLVEKLHWQHFPLTGHLKGKTTLARFSTASAPAFAGREPERREGSHVGLQNIYPTRGRVPEWRLAPAFAGARGRLAPRPSLVSL